MKQGASYEWAIPHMTVRRDQIMNEVCRQYECTRDELRSDKRVRHLMDARCVYTYLTRTRLRDTTVRVGMELNKDHSAVSYYMKKTEDLLYIKDPIKDVIQEIERKLFKQPIQP